MVAKSENINQTENKFLMLLNKVGVCGDVDGGRGEEGEGGKKRVFRCKTCLKEFSSFQALGGHRASHNKQMKNGEDQSSSTKKAKPMMTSHTCPTCGAEFPMGQALGGHMRRHRNEKEKDGGGALVTRSFLPEETSTSSTVTTFKKSTSGKRIACLDYGSVDSVESFVNLELELGLTIS